MTEAVRIEELCFSHVASGLPTLDQVTLSIPPGEALALIGPSGAGKTTLLTLLDGRLRAWRGRVSVLGDALDPDRAPPRARRADTGFIFQDFALVERASVLRNVLNGRLGRIRPLRALLGRPSKDDLAVARSALADCGIVDLAERRVDSLSGGQRQRVAIARCLSQEPRLILADEPVSNLDPARAAEILSLLTEAARQRGATTVFSSHQPDLARRFARRIVGMRNGRIVFDIPTAELTEDATARVYDDANATVQPRLKAVP
ncbi:MAG: ATP-binding cassette domain-containing protein [Hoeflea sp.]|uniref:phosphonate ABC transporter ATP-binding protein n=1 Tax=Hoeflea sp. TaxID=1940281 RepID=UPI001D94C19D|nr:ATP-binding cassette domain-containing protein [Hoeflea sp.]MBU4527535.1 ATP-binding cassette domain-containing protein [Alphaproteobacteria bacterium]MBU4543979.1 ATP-binding cassette domain-containing protein [Alphaproteobacteria bacterium]MBU4552399.1 ATP-binding cassette domain-containing protein [Alphaproteobacteria bacterium]MBV1726038.1 ATP-binding cassette domain-containing protein [Hoeflea sp.]MBV1782396.1 ATP-binding cassette domain-containing protein [Hoeflea sp.]